LSPGRSIQFWRRIIAAELDPAAPVLISVPIDQYWMDLIAGEPLPADLFCLRVSPRTLSLTCDEIADPPDDFHSEARALFEHVASGAQGAFAGRDQSTWMGRLFGR
jgi:hypothetical protein